MVHFDLLAGHLPIYKKQVLSGTAVCHKSCSQHNTSFLSELGMVFAFQKITGKGVEKCASSEKVNMEWQMEMKAALCPGKSFQKVLRGDSGKVNIQIRQKVARPTSTV